MSSNNSEPLFRPLSIAEAPESTRAILTETQKALGFLPNLFSTFANSPAVLQGYVALSGAFDHAFTPAERNLILLTVSVVNDCRYCKAAHSKIGKAMLKTPSEVIDAIKNGSPLPDEKLGALVALTREIVIQKGSVTPATLEAFLAAGYTKSQVMEILLGVALKTISNYLDHLNPTELDEAIRDEA